MNVRGQPLHQLTGLRALASAWVLAFHLLSPARRLFPSIGFEARLVEAGYLGVDVFFVLSGFVLSHAYAQSIRLQPRALGAFLWARVARVWPLHAAVTLALVAACLAAKALHLRSFGESPLFRFEDLPAHLALVHAWGGHQQAWNVPSWSVSAEWLAYLAFPFVALAAAMLRRPLALALVAALVVVAFALTTELAFGGSLDLTYSGAPLRVAAGFTVGVLLERAARLGDVHVGDALLGVAAAALVGAILLSAEGPWLVAPIAVFVVGLARSNGRASRLLASAPLGWLGERSYALYLVHGPVMLVARSLLPIERASGWSLVARAGWLALVVGVSVALAALAFRLVEEPARTAMRRVSLSRPTVRA